MAVEIQSRAYDADCSPEETEAIRARVYAFDEDIVMYREMPVQSNYQLALFRERLMELTAHRPSFVLLLDLTEAHPPNAESRARLREMFGALKNARAVAVFTGKNFVLNIAAKFVLNGLLGSCSVHRTQEEALKVLRNALLR
jgi:hypothetical protein